MPKTKLNRDDDVFAVIVDDDYKILPGTLDYDDGRYCEIRFWSQDGAWSHKKLPSIDVHESMDAAKEFRIKAIECEIRRKINDTKALMNLLERLTGGRRPSDQSNTTTDSPQSPKSE